MLSYVYPPCISGISSSPEQSGDTATMFWMFRMPSFYSISSCSIPTSPHLVPNGNAAPNPFLHPEAPKPWTDMKFGHVWLGGCPTHMSKTSNNLPPFLTIDRLQEETSETSDLPEFLSRWSLEFSLYQKGQKFMRSTKTWTRQIVNIYVLSWISIWFTIFDHRHYPILSPCLSIFQSARDERLQN